MRKELKEAHSAILIFFDLWTSPNTHAVLGIVAYFINKDSRRRYIVLGLYEVYSKHTSKNMAAILIALFKDYRIAGNLGYFITV